MKSKKDKCWILLLKMLQFKMCVQTGGEMLLTKRVLRSWNTPGGGSCTGFGWKSLFFPTGTVLLCRFEIKAVLRREQRFAVAEQHLHSILAFCSSFCTCKEDGSGWLCLEDEGTEADKIMVIFSPGVLSCCKRDQGGFSDKNKA